MDNVVKQCTALTAVDIAFLEKIKVQLGIMADLSRGDGLLYGPVGQDKAVVLAHARPHSIAPAYQSNLKGIVVDTDQAPLALRALASGRRVRGGQGNLAGGAPLMKEVLPICSPPDHGRTIGVISIDTNLLEHERHHRRSVVFQRALAQLQASVQQGLLRGVESLSPFGEHEGVLVVDREGFIRYASGIVTNLYRRLGYVENLVGRHLESLETFDDKLARMALRERRCFERETEEGGRVWVRKALPLFVQPSWRQALGRFVNLSPQPDRLAGVILVVRDATESRRKEQELRVKSTMIQEVHHRVKNNLQTIAALLRIQGRRVETPEAKIALGEATNRILSVAVIHEFLSDQTSRTINIKDVSHRILTQLEHSVMNPDQEIRLELDGPPVLLPARQATAAALVINELVQNAMEHGFEGRKSGTVRVCLEDAGDRVVVMVQDDGEGLPSNFELSQANSLGLQIVQTLAEEDLKGEFELRDAGGTCAIVTFPKATFGGEEDWKRHV